VSNLLNNENINENRFIWENIGDIQQGRINLGDEIPISIYRLMQFTLLDVMRKRLGEEEAHNFFREAGFVAGIEFSRKMLNLEQEFDKFISHLQEVLKAFKIGILRMEKMQMNTGEIVLTIAEDLDCSGLPITGDNVCIYDEGFLKGILESYTGHQYDVKEIDCWANGDRICRFRGTRLNI